MLNYLESENSSFQEKKNKNIIKGFGGRNIHLKKEKTNDAINPPGNLAKKTV